ncbi:MAG: DNA-protecting protein DprA [bacterium]|nr:DNA-protecting protein DprA [bacterium]
MEKEADYFKSYLALSLVPGVGPIVFKRLLAEFNSPEDALAASESRLQQIYGIGPKIARAISGFAADEAIEKELEKADKFGADVIILDDSRYPPLLKEIYTPPLVLYVKGDLKRLAEQNVAVVGTRLVSGYGKKAARYIVKGLAEAGCGIVSGLARGVDTEAHRAALAAGGPTFGVLGCGVDVVYPPENRKIFGEVAERGALISEFPMGTRPDGKNFPRRNRIISGLTQATVVVEAPMQSGASITAAHALQQNREVFAVPGNIFAEGAKGTNALISRGAFVAACADDVLEVIAPEKVKTDETKKKPKPPPDVELDDREKAVLEVMRDDRLHIDEIGQALEINASELAQLMTVLEIKAIVIRYPGKFFERGV